MRFGTASRPWLRTVIVLASLVATNSWCQGLRLLEAGSVTERDDHLDLAVEFSCTLRYQAHSPASESGTLRVILQFGPDCGLASISQFPVERILPADSAGLVRSIEMQPGLAGGAELIVQWNRIEKYVLAPTAGMRGMRIRVTRPKTGATVQIDESPNAIGSYAVNLISSREAIDARELGEARQSLNAPVYMSDYIVGGLLWHRLRAGPFSSRREAERVLREAKIRYAGAWMGIDDEVAETTLADGELPTLPKTPATPSVPELRIDEDLDRELDQARTAMAKRRYDDAVALLTKILASPDYVHRVDAQEMLGLARERKGQLAHAKAEYEEFLRRYADAKAAARVRQRLQALRTAALAGRRGTGGGASGIGWTAYGSASQIYRRDNSQLRSDALSRDLVTQNAVISDVDGVVRHRGERLDFTGRATFGYLKDLMTSGPGDQPRVSSAYVDFNDREWGLGARLGRQSRGMAGVFGSFDGLLGTWQWKPQLGFSLVAGMPVESTRFGPDTHRQFVGMAADYANASRSWDTSVYALAQQYYGSADRRSVGVETRYFKPGRTLVAMLDYDVNFSTINNVMLLGTAVLDSRWTFNFDLGRQSSPVLSIRNSLIGQPTTSFEELTQQFALADLEQFALDRSAVLTQLSLSASHPLGERGQWTLNLVSSDFSGTPASGGVEAVPALGRDDSITSEILMNSLLKAGDIHSVALRYQQGASGDLMSIGLGSRMPIGSTFRLTSRFRVDHRTQLLDGTQQWLYLPSLRLDYLRGRNVAELEVGAELGNRDGAFSERTTRYFFSLGYRLSLDWGRR
jgi:tetratricopeptide (TPR) repeat protein